MTATQLTLFPQPPQDTIKVVIIDYGGYYQAEIAGGWWIARGKSKESAIKNVIKRYEVER